MLGFGGGSLINGRLSELTALFSLSVVSRFEASCLVVEDASYDGALTCMAGLEVPDVISAFFLVPDSAATGLGGLESKFLFTWISGVSTVADSSEDCEITIDGWESTEGNAFSTLSGDSIASAIVNESGSLRNR